MLNALKWMNVKERIQMNKLQFIQKKKKKKTNENWRWPLMPYRATSLFWRNTTISPEKRKQRQNTKNNHNKYGNITTI